MDLQVSPGKFASSLLLCAAQSRYGLNPKAAGSWSWTVSKNSKLSLEGRSGEKLVYHEKKAMNKSIYLANIYFLRLHM